MARIFWGEKEIGILKSFKIEGADTNDCCDINDIVVLEVSIENTWEKIYNGPVGPLGVLLEPESEKHYEHIITRQEGSIKVRTEEIEKMVNIFNKMGTVKIYKQEKLFMNDGIITEIHISELPPYCEAKIKGNVEAQD